MPQFPKPQGAPIWRRWLCLGECSAEGGVYGTEVYGTEAHGTEAHGIEVHAIVVHAIVVHGIVVHGIEKDFRKFGL
jgi:hypothetical protein